MINVLIQLINGNWIDPTIVKLIEIDPHNRDMIRIETTLTEVPRAPCLTRTVYIKCDNVDGVQAARDQLANKINEAIAQQRAKQWVPQ